MKKLLVILGAGSSIPYGMPSVDCINKHMLDWSSEWTESETPTNSVNVYKDIWEISKCYFNKYPFHGGAYPNYESVFGEMTSVAKWLSQPTFGNPIIEEISSIIPTSTLGELFNFSVNATRVDKRDLILDQQEFLIRKLAEFIRNRCKKGPTKEQLSGYSIFLKELRKHFDVGIYNLNYDNVAIRAWPDAYNGFDDVVYSYPPSNAQINGLQFDPISIFKRKKWGFIYQIHGSVHFNLKKKSILEKIVGWEDSLNKNFDDYCSKPLNPDNNSMSMPLTTLLAGGFKLEQLLPEPFHTFYASLAKHIYEADAFLIVGYGFGDMHVNQAIQNRFELPNFQNRNKTNLKARQIPKVVILDKSCPEYPHTARIQGTKFKPWQMTHTFKTSFLNKGSKDNRTIIEVVDKDGFETSNNWFAIWHGGVIKAFSDASKIINRL